MRTGHACALSGLALVGALAATAARAAPMVVGALGDSITAGFDVQRFGDNREFSWATGDSPLVLSHAQRLAATGATVTSFNEAIVGSEVDGLSRQIDRLLTHNPDYVTVTIGANDICNWPDDYEQSLTDFGTTLTTDLERIITARPNVKINLSAIPNLPNLYQVASVQPGCQERWDLIGLCKPLLPSTATQASRDAFVTRWQRANAALTQVAQAHPANVLHNPDAANLKFEWHHVSTLDCFHPSIDGQNLLSEVAWQTLEQ